MIRGWPVAVALAVLIGAPAFAAEALRGHTELPDPVAERNRLPVAMTFFDAQHGLMVTAGGSLLATMDGGHAWHRGGRLAATDLEAVSQVSAYATTSRTLLRTDDRGRHWRVVAHVSGSLSFADPSHGWVVGRRAFTTDDGGRTLRRLRVPCAALQEESWALSRVSAGLGFAACGGQPGAGNQLKRLYITHDGGRTWRLGADERRMPSGGYLSSIRFTDARHGLMTAVRAGLLATADGGRTWRTLLLSDDVTDILSAERLGRGLLAVLLGNGAFLRSPDGGAHWRLGYPHTLPRPGQVTFSTVSDGIGSGYADWTFSHPAIVATRDGGRTWHARGRLPGGAVVQKLVRASHDVVYAVADEMLFRSRDDGRTWSRVKTPARSTFGVSFVTLRDGVVGDSAGRLYATHDGGATWMLIRPAGIKLVNFAFLTTRRALALSAVAGDDALYETRDGGRSWHRFTRAPVQRPLGFATLGANYIWIVDMPRCSDAATRNQPNCPGAVVRTTDGGRTWERIALNMIPGSDSLDFVTPRVGYARDPWSGPYRTIDGGRNWALVAQ